MSAGSPPTPSTPQQNGAPPLPPVPPGAFFGGMPGMAGLPPLPPGMLPGMPGGPPFMFPGMMPPPGMNPGQPFPGPPQGGGAPVPFPPGWMPPGFTMPPGGFPFPFPPPPGPGHQAPTPYRAPPPPTPSGASGSATPAAPMQRPSEQVAPVQNNARGSRKPHNFKGSFVKELKPMMFGFGDEYHGAQDSAALLEEILIEYILNVCDAASDGGRKTRLVLEDLRAALSHPADASKLARMDELVFMQGEIKKARSEFKDDIESGNA